MNSLVLCAALLSASIADEAPLARHPWPFAPADRAHEIANHFCAPLRFDETRGYLHGGIDIRKPAATPVLAVATGTVWIYREGYLDNLVLTEPNGDSWEYRHLFADRIPPEVRRAHERGTKIAVGTVIGEVAPWGLDYAHLHFNHRRADGTIVDPLSVLLPLPDATPPTIDAIELLPADGSTPYPRETDGRVVVSGAVDIVVRASDRIALERWKHPPRLAWADLLDRSGERTRLATWNPFETKLPLPAKLPVPRYPRGRGLEAYQRIGPLATVNPIPAPAPPQSFTLVVTNGREKSADRRGSWETEAVPDGHYTLEVGVEDAAGLRATKTLPLEVRNSTPPPRPPELPRTDPTSGLERTLAARGYATCFAGDRVEHAFSVPRAWCDGEWNHRPELEVIDTIADGETCLVAVRVDTTGLRARESFQMRNSSQPLQTLILLVEVHPLIEVAPRPRLRRDAEGNVFLKIRLRTPASSSCLEARWENGAESGQLRVTRHGLRAPTVHCMTIEVVVPEAARGGTMHCTMTSLGRTCDLEIAIPTEFTSEAL